MCNLVTNDIHKPSQSVVAEIIFLKNCLIKIPHLDQLQNTMESNLGLDPLLVKLQKTFLTKMYLTCTYFRFGSSPTRYNGVGVGL